MCAFGVAPSFESSRDVPPNMVGLKPARNAIGRLAHQGPRVLMDLMVMNDLKAHYNAIVAAYGLPPIEGSLFDVFYRCPDVVFQSGVPGFAYPRHDPNPKVKFVGALQPYKAPSATSFTHSEKLAKYKQVILISQGTVEKDASKLIVPGLEALKDTDALLMRSQPLRLAVIGFGGLGSIVSFIPFVSRHTAIADAHATMVSVHAACY